MSRAQQVVLGALLVLGTLLFAFGEDDWKRTLNQPSADGAYYYAYLPSLFLDGDLDFTNEYAVTKNWYRTGLAPTGTPGNFFGIGPALYAAPFWLVGHGLAIVTGSERDGFSACESGLVHGASILFTLGAVFLAMCVAQRRLGSRAASIAGPVLALLAGPVCYYAIRQPGYAHPCATFAATLLLERWDASYDSPRTLRTWIVLGACLGAATLARPQLLLWGIALAAAALDDVTKKQPVPRVLARGAIAGVVAIVVFSPQLFAWRALYGEWWTVPQGPGFMQWSDPAWLETIFSSRNGLLPWAPLYAPMLLGLFFVARRLVVVGLLGLLLQAIANGAAYDWWAGGSFGGRRFDSTYLVFAVGAAALVARAIEIVRARRVIHRGLVGVAGVWVLLALVGQLTLMMKTSVTSARITGGEPAAEIYVRRAGLAGIVTAYTSAAVTFPMRAVFAFRHDVSLGAYDRLVGVHRLGETYPGLNAYDDQRHDRIAYAGIRPPYFEGLARTSNDLARFTAAHARIFVGLNRADDVSVSFTVRGTGRVVVRWDGDVVADKDFSPEADISFVVGTPGRGPHWLKISAPVGAQLTPIELAALPASSR